MIVTVIVSMCRRLIGDTDTSPKCHSRSPTVTFRWKPGFKETITKGKTKLDVIDDNNGNTLTEAEALHDRWREYCTEFIIRQGGGGQQEAEIDLDLEGIKPSPLKSEIEEAMKILKTRKAPDADDIPIEFQFQWAVQKNIEKNSDQQKTMEKFDLYIPRMTTSKGQIAISFRGAKTWNQLSTDTKEASSLNSFKCKLKRHLQPTL